MLYKLLGSDAVGPSWDFCAAAVDYDVARKEVSAIFDTKVAEVQGMVSKLLQTQRAAEQALDKYWIFGMPPRQVRERIYCAATGTRGHVPLRLCTSQVLFFDEREPRCLSCMRFAHGHLSVQVSSSCCPVQSQGLRSAMQRGCRLCCDLCCS